MKNVLILGAGRVGRRAAEQLAADENEVTIIDRSPAALRMLREHADVRTLAGEAERPAVLDKAGAQEADVVLATTSLDTVNLAASLVCANRYDELKSQKRIARIRSSEISSDQQLLELFGVSQAFCPEQIVTDALLGPIKHPGVSQIHNLAGGAAVIAEIVIEKSRAALGRTVAENEKAVADTPFRIVAIHRGKELILPQPETRMRHNDRVYVAAPAAAIMGVTSYLHSEEDSSKRICIAGGGNIGLRLATMLEKNYSVTVIDSERSRCAHLSQELSRSLVLHGDATDEKLLTSEEIGRADFFIAVSQHDEINIMASLLARRIGAGNVATLINRDAYKAILDDYPFDVVITPSDLTIGTLLRHVRDRSFELIESLRGGAEVLEFQVHKDTDKVLGNLLAAIDWPEGSAPVLIVRNLENEQGAQVLFPDQGPMVELGDRLIIYASSRKLVPKIEQLLSASPLR
ncbi:MAG: Trk system potassium transporter TrkA [Betaproteobacteria bacterium]|nr:Trk system potassium transporter TrkA [Betaproteobacteria bacterium]